MNAISENPNADPAMWYLNLIILVIAFCCMELVAWATHKYIMHGLLWSLHRDHHRKDHNGMFERNDAFFLIFAAPAIALYAFGAPHGMSDPRIWMAMGITLYGLAYFVVHDVFIHQRGKWLRNPKNRYLRAIRRAHKLHHKHLERTPGECFGMLIVPWRFLRDPGRTADRGA